MVLELQKVVGDAMRVKYFIQLEDKILGKDWLKSFATKILDAKYEFTEVADVVKDLAHLQLDCPSVAHWDLVITFAVEVRF